MAGPSLFSVGPSGQPLQLANSTLIAAATVSPNGRFDVWADAACRRLGGRAHAVRVYLLDLSQAGSVPELLAMPSAYSEAGFESISVNSEGRVTALVSNSDQDCAGAGYAGGYRRAIISAAPGSSHMQVVASAEVFANDAYGSPQVIGNWAASPDASTLALCYLTGPGFVPDARGHPARWANLVDVSGGATLTISRASVRVARTQWNSVLGGCAAADIGIATMAFLAPGGVRKVRVLGAADRLHSTVRSSGNVLSPSGRLVANVNYPTLLTDLGTGRTSRIPVPRAFRSGFSGGVLPQDGELAFEPYWPAGPTWVAPQAILAYSEPASRNAEYEAVLNPQTRRWSKPFRWSAMGDQLIYCALSSGRILFARNRFPGNTSQLYISNNARTRFSRIVTSSLGAITGVSCPIAGNTVYVSVGSSPTTLLSASDSSIDGSPWATG